jgi:FKBP-type peptidyl-prolyl cis-trans isomerase
MVAFRGAVRWHMVGVAVVAFAGCAGDTDGSKVPTSPVQTAPAAGGRATGKPKTAELPTLPRGAGEMDPDAPEELTPTGSGLYYRILRRGDGRKPGPTNTVLAHYRGTLDNGNEFDSSYKRGEPTSFPVNRVIEGWIEGLQLIGEGGMIELEIPAHLGYPHGQGDIPPGATLHFIVELKKVM